MNRPLRDVASSLTLDAAGKIVDGGVLILDTRGVAIGAVGISGDTSDKDEYCAIQGVHAAGLASDPAEPNPEWKASGL
jgi:uncharacterized protein GlcG (DUF336 family)